MKAFKNIINNIKSYVISFYFATIVFCWISVIIYIRFIVKRSSYTLIEFRELFTIKYILLHITFILIHILFICYAIYIIKRRHAQQNNTSSNVIINSIKKLNDILLVKPFTYIRDIISPNIPYSSLIYCRLGEFLENSSLWVNKAIVILFYVTPRIIVSVIFCIEIIFYQRIYYFIPSLFLLLIPLLWSVFLNLFTDFGLRGLQEIPTYVQVIGIGDPFTNGYYPKYTFIPYDKYEYPPGQVEEYGETYLIALIIYGYGEIQLKGFQERLSPYMTLFISSVYILTTIYKLLFLLTF